MGLKHGVEAREGFASTSKEHHACSGTIKAVSNPKEYLARFLVFLFDIRFHHLRERRIARLIALHNLVASLADSYYMIIFV